MITEGILVNSLYDLQIFVNYKPWLATSVFLKEKNQDDSF